MRKWYRKFRNAGKNIIDESFSGRLISVTDKILENKVEAIIQRDQKARLSDIGIPSKRSIMVLFRISLQKTEISKKNSVCTGTYG